MNSGSESVYHDREQTELKHYILGNYLEQLAIIVGSFKEGILYIDGFSGPWNAKGGGCEDTSFAIALDKLRSARKAVQQAHKKELKIRCVFVEENAESFHRLDHFAKMQGADVEIATMHSSFGDALPRIQASILKGEQVYFPFIFIDPTGFTGFSMDKIGPLLRSAKCEVLVNFMSSFITRFAMAEHEWIPSRLKDLYGKDYDVNKLISLSGKHREDKLVFDYADSLGKHGQFKYTPVALIPHPTKDRTHFHLIYGSSHIKGLEVFKKVEEGACRLSGELRAEAKRRSRESRSSQMELFNGESLPDFNFIQSRHEHYASSAQAMVVEALKKRRIVPFDDLYSIALRFPTINIDDLRGWISDLGCVAHLGPNQRKLCVGRDNSVSLDQG